MKDTAVSDFKESIAQENTLYGKISYFNFDGPIGDSIKTYHEWAAAEISFVKQFLTPGCTVIDGGANIGTHTLAMAHFCGRNGHVISIEASPEIYSVLKMNVENNNLLNVSVFNSAISSAPGVSYIPSIEGYERINTGSLRVTDSKPLNENFYEVENIVIDGLHLENLSLIKLDVEGAELSALEGGKDTISKLRPVVIVELINADKGYQVIEFMQKLGYKSIYCEFPVYMEKNLAGNRENIFGAACEAALLFLPNSHHKPLICEDCSIAIVESKPHLSSLINTMPQSAPGDAAIALSQYEAYRFHSIRKTTRAEMNLPNDTASSEAKINALEKATGRLDQQLQKQLIDSTHYLNRMKSELSDLKGAVFNNIEDRSAIVVEMNRMRDEVAKSEARGKSLEESIQLQDKIISATVESLHEFERTRLENDSLLASRLAEIGARIADLESLANSSRADLQAGIVRMHNIVSSLSLIEGRIVRLETRTKWRRVREGLANALHRFGR